MTIAFLFSSFLLALLYATCSGNACFGNWSTDIANYTIIQTQRYSYVHVICNNQDYRVHGPNAVKCVDENLPKNLPQCIQIKDRCHQLKAPLHGSMKCGSRAPEVGSSCSFKCQSSHYGRGSRTRVCSRDLLWTGSGTRCYPKPECSEPPPLHHGKVTGCSSERKPKYNDTCDFQCDEGFRLVGPRRLACTLDGRLTDEGGRHVIPRCLHSFVQCPRVSIPHHSTLRCKNTKAGRMVIFRPGEMPDDKRFPAGAVCRAKCDKGYHHLRDSNAGIVCQKEGQWNASLPDCHVLQCPPLSPPTDGDVYPSSCKEEPSAVKRRCVFTCNPGYRIEGQEVLTCRNNLDWSKRKPTRCVPETEVSISCPDDDITIELASNEGWAALQLNRPKTKPKPGPVLVNPAWVSLDRASMFPAGETEVTFSVSRDNKTADCSIFVVVLDNHPPVFRDCPDSLTATAGTAVNWEEPFPEDNVGIALMTKNLEPGSILSPGIHFVEYVARDFSGNIAQCIFQISVTANSCKDLADPENGEANCLEWMSGKICQPTCFENYTRPDELFACDESGTWTPTDIITPCLQCNEDKEMCKNSNT